jgi:hypothetical protein
MSCFGATGRARVHSQTLSRHRILTRLQRRETSPFRPDITRHTARRTGIGSSSRSVGFTTAQIPTDPFRLERCRMITPSRLERGSTGEMRSPVFCADRHHCGKRQIALRREKMERSCKNEGAWRRSSLTKSPDFGPFASLGRYGHYLCGLCRLRPAPFVGPFLEGMGCLAPSRRHLGDVAFCWNYDRRFIARRTR